MKLLSLILQLLPLLAFAEAENGAETEQKKAHEVIRLTEEKPNTASAKTDLQFPVGHIGRYLRGEFETRFSNSKASHNFPIGRIGRYLKEGDYAKHLGAGAPVYLAAVLESMCAELLYLAGNVARHNKKGRIVPHHITLAVKNDEDLNRLLNGVPGGSNGPTRNLLAESDEELERLYSTYIYKVLKQVHRDTGISTKAMIIMNSFINDLFERIATKAGKLAASNKKDVLTSREIRTAVHLMLPGELARHANSVGEKALAIFNSN